MGSLVCLGFSTCMTCMFCCFILTAVFFFAWNIFVIVTVAGVLCASAARRARLLRGKTQ